VINVSSQTPPPPQSGGTTYYVAPTGSDSNPGTSSQPFRTIQKAADLVDPGDTVIVRDGVYKWESGLNNCYSKTIVCMNRGGTSTNWVVFKSENKWGARLDGQNSTNDGFVFNNGISYVRVEGFDICGLMDTASSTAQGFSAYSGGSNSQIVGNRIHNISNHCTASWGMGIYIKRNNVLVEGNLIYEVRNFALGEQGCNIDNPNHSHGVYLSGNSSDPSNRASGAVIRNNVFFGITGGWPIHLYPGTLDNIRIFNNTFADANPKRSGHVLIYSVTLSNAQIQNNIFHQPNTTAISIGSGNVTLNNVTISHNITTAGTITDNYPSGSDIQIQQNVVAANPQMVNPTDGIPDRRDFRLLPGSPAIDAGVAVSGVTVDFDGNRRPQGGGYDLGAYEYSGSSSQAKMLLPGPQFGWRQLSARPDLVTGTPNCNNVQFPSNKKSRARLALSQSHTAASFRNDLSLLRNEVAPREPHARSIGVREHAITVAERSPLRGSRRQDDRVLF
jgi:hypothetical protein